MRTKTKSMYLLCVFLLISTASLKANASFEEIRALVRQFYERDYSSGHCYANIGELAQELIERALVDGDKANVVIVENTDNDLVLGTDQRRYQFHVFLIEGNMVIDPLLMELGMNEYGFTTDCDQYLETMFPNLKGAKFTTVPALLYIALEERPLLSKFFQAYLISATDRLGERRLGRNGMPPVGFNGIWRLPLTQFGHALGLF